MDRQQILDLYAWSPGICFRHPRKGRVSTTTVGVVHPSDVADKTVRGCEDCVITMEDIRREDAARAGSDYTPGQLGKCPG